MPKKHKLLFIHHEWHSTFENDINLLKDDFDVIRFIYTGKKNVFRLFWAILRTDVNMSRFVLGHATLAVMLSRILRKKSIVVVEGWDVVYMPEIDYGALKSEKRRKKTRYALKHANAVIAVSESLKKDALKLENRDIRLIYHCLDSDKFKPVGKKVDMAITVGDVRKDTYLRKGLKAFAEAARYVPEIEFYLIGNLADETVDRLKSISTPNVRFTGFVPDDELRDYMHKAKVYVQVSAHEGFGISLAEAMLCECVPVVTDRGAIPEVVGDCGFYVPFDDAKATAEAIKKALRSDLGPRARERIKNNFSMNKRKEKLNALVWEVLGKDSPYS